MLPEKDLFYSLSSRSNNEEQVSHHSHSINYFLKKFGWVPCNHRKRLARITQRKAPNSYLRGEKIHWLQENKRDMLSKKT